MAPSSSKQGSVLIYVAGNVNVDVILGPTSIPAWGTEVIVETFEIRAAGAAGTTARALARLGLDATLIGAVGDDPQGDMIVSALAGDGVAIHGLQRMRDQATGESVGIFRPDGERLFVTYLGALCALDDSWLDGHIQVSRLTILVMTGLYLSPGISVVGLAAMFQRIKQAGGITVLDTGWNPLGWMAARDVLKPVLSETVVLLPNEDEALGLSGATSVSDALTTLLSLGPNLVVVKRGAAGAIAATPEGTWSTPALSTPVGDTAGAGDVFNAGIVYGLAQGWSVPALLRFANTAAALAIRPGARVFPTLLDVRTTLDNLAQAGERIAIDG